jgi:hypothetical protein
MWLLLGIPLWTVGSIPVAVVIGRMLSASDGQQDATGASAATTHVVRRRALLVDDDPALQL